MSEQTGARLRTPLLAATLVVSVGGCTLGPNFKPPASPSPAGYTAPDEATSERPSAGAPRQTIALGEDGKPEWWTLFHSPALDGLVKQAIAGSPTLDSAKTRLATARESVNEASSSLYPQVGFNASVTRERVTATSFGLSPSQFALPPVFNLFQIGPTASYTADIFGGTYRQIEQQRALADYQRYQVDATYMNLTGSTVLQVLQVAAERAQLKAVGDIVKIDQQNLTLVQTERTAGAVPDSDVVIAENQLAADETLQPGLDQQMSVAKHALAVLLGRTPADFVVPDFDLTALTLPPSLPVSLPSALVHHRPDILAAEAQLHAASAQIGVATAQLYPAITLSAGVGTAALDPARLFDPSGFVWSIAAGLTQPIFDGGLRRAERRAALDSFKASAADYQQTVLQAFGQVADILQALVHDADLLAAQKHALDTASESVRLQRISFGAGGTGVLNLLEAQRQYQQALLGYVRAEAQRYLDTTQLLVAMGGSALQPVAGSADAPGFRF